jgi:hypothetical protein
VIKTGYLTEFQNFIAVRSNLRPCVFRASLASSAATMNRLPLDGTTLSVCKLKFYPTHKVYPVIILF